MVAVITVLVVHVSCKPTVPSEYIQEDELEALLYDYHMADGIARHQKGDYDTNLIALRAGVLKKHGVSQAEFDSTMVYYMRHTDRLHSIYERLSERLSRESQEFGANTSGLTLVTSTGDTADVWKGPKGVTLIPNQPYNVHQFSLKTDSSFHKGDRVVLMFRTNFIFQDGSRNGLAYMAVVYNNDSVAARNLRLSSSSSYNLQLDAPDSLGIKELKGFLMLGKNNQANASATTLHVMNVNDIHLFRCHVAEQKRPKPTQPAKTGNDSTARKADATLRPDSVERDGDQQEKKDGPLTKPLHKTPVLELDTAKTRKLK